MARGTESAETLDISPQLRFAALSGAMCVVATLLGLRIGDVFDRSRAGNLLPGSLVDAVEDHLGAVRTAAALLALAAVFALFFVGAVWSHVRQAADWLAVVAAGAGVLLAVQLLGLAGRGYELADLAELDEASTAQALLTTTEVALRHLALPVLVLAVVVAMAGFGHRLFPTWFRWASVVAAVALAVVLIPLGTPSIVAVAGGVWLSLASLVFGLGDLLGWADQAPQSGRRAVSHPGFDGGSRTT